MKEKLNHYVKDQLAVKEEKIKSLTTSVKQLQKVVNDKSNEIENLKRENFHLARQLKNAIANIPNDPVLREW